MLTAINITLPSRFAATVAARAVLPAKTSRSLSSLPPPGGFCF